ncbi:hypothetical protein B9Z19DRAFT_1127468 [Tuber borchii]|uniref:Ankyrin repeat-containing domain protein n=1 Tax=Tuber borchii TaxID=42251 RepID=A0A2T6ZR86_TUBBO|nr:hypothetical protein B9Z19DRAFT_1127468 [Tuber borchii]
MLNPGPCYNSPRRSSEQQADTNVRNNAGADARIKSSAGMTPLHCALAGAVEALTQIFTGQGMGTSPDTDTTTVQTLAGCTGQGGLDGAVLGCEDREVKCCLVAAREGCRCVHLQ